MERLLSNTIIFIQNLLDEYLGQKKDYPVIRLRFKPDSRGKYPDIVPFRPGPLPITSYPIN
jgi:hypothetical protein